MLLKDIHILNRKKETLFFVFLGFLIIFVCLKGENSINERNLALMIYERLNEELKKNSIKSLEWDEDLYELAKGHSEEMAKYDYFDSINLNGLSPNERAEKRNIICGRKKKDGYEVGIAENILKISLYRLEKKDGKEIFVRLSEEELIKIVIDNLLRDEKFKNEAKNFKSEGIGVSFSEKGYVYITQDLCEERIEVKNEKEPNVDVQLLAKRIHELVNEERRKRGLNELKWSDDLSRVAYEHSLDMAQNNYFSHINLNGKNPTERAIEKGIDVKLRRGNLIRVGIGENIFQNNLIKSVFKVGDLEYKEYRDLEELAKSTVEGWMKSKGHRENILEQNYTMEGIGIVIKKSGEVYITQNFF